MADLHIEPSELARIIEEKSAKYSIELGADEIGHVLETGDGIARADGMPGLMAEEMVVFSEDVYGMAMNLERHDIGLIVFGDYTKIQQNDVVKRTCKVLQVPVGKALLGRVVTPLGRPLDGKGPVSTSETRLVELDAPGIVDREPVGVPLQTGLKSIDAMTAIGRGQRELIIGDRQTGKTTLALDTIINQKPGDVACVYVAVGQKMSTVANLVSVLEEHNAMQNTIVVIATASDSAPLQYIAPFAGCAMAEFFRDSGEDALIVYDDLTKHAIAYREISLLLRRPPGREAFPGDIFYLHSRLLERAGRLHADKGGGSLTALPIVETQQGDYSAYIPTNLVSITDGQIYLQGELFHQGFRPAINVGLSVSRVGGRAQLSAMKKVALQLRIDLAQYREAASFAQLTGELDPATMRQLHRGERLAEILKQDLHEPMPVEKQITMLWLGVHEHLREIPLIDIARFEKEWLRYIASTYPDIEKSILETGDLTEETVTQLKEAIESFRGIFVSTERAETLGHKRVVMSDEESAATAVDDI